MPRLLLSDELRERLKTPVGNLLIGPPQQTISQLREIIDKERPPMIVCVGDFVSKNLKNANIRVDVSVVDYKIMRLEADPWQEPGKTVFRAKNSAGTIDPMAWEALREAIEKKNSLLIIEGEEDLLTLPAILLAPDGAFVIYGQPKQGMVVVTVNSKKRTEIQAIVDAMTNEDR